jgi:Right handed beta helix region
LATFVLLLGAFPAVAFGQATRTWVSGTGDDANPCSRTAPCKTFPGAYSKTAVGGEINVIDPGGFGTITIGHSLTISAVGVTAGVLASGSNGIVIAAGAGDRVVLRGLDINGIGAGFDGVRVLSAGQVRIEDSKIYQFVDNGVDFEPSNPDSRLVIANTTIEGNAGNGVFAAPQTGGSGRVALTHDEVDGNSCGLVASSRGGGNSNFGTDCGTDAGPGGGGPVTVNSSDTSLDNNSGVGAGAGVLTNGSTAANYITKDLITGNGYGIRSLNGGLITSFGDNEIFDNSINGTPTSSASKLAHDNVRARAAAYVRVRVRWARRHRHH